MVLRPHVFVLLRSYDETMGLGGEPLPLLWTCDYIPKNPDDWEYAVDTMVEVMHGEKGTARAVGRGAAYKMAGKTGTAQVFSLAEDEEYNEEEIRERLRDHALFVGFAPADNPEIAVAVIVENGGSGSGTAAPVARALFDSWLLDYGQADGALLSGVNKVAN